MLLLDPLPKVVLVGLAVVGRPLLAFLLCLCSLVAFLLLPRPLRLLLLPDGEVNADDEEDEDEEEEEEEGDDAGGAVRTEKGLGAPLPTTSRQPSVKTPRSKIARTIRNMRASRSEKRAKMPIITSNA